MTPLDTDIMQRKLTVILTEVKHLKDFLSSKQTQKDFRWEYSLLFSLQKSVAAVCDIATHIIARESEEVGDSYADAIIKLGKIGVLPTEFALKIANVAKFRNKVVHEYETVDINKVLEFLPRAIEDLATFAKHIQKFLERGGK